MECNIWLDLSCGGDFILLSVFVGLVLAISLFGFKWTAVFVGLSSIAFHEIFKPNWKEIFQGLFMIVSAIPRSIFIGIYTLFLKRETFETIPNTSGVPEVLSTTLIPDSIVLMSDNLEHHIHKLVRK